ncbi:MAG: DUF5682 family protein [Neomegalonema sp.]|nr:DUF5682 family protein [Neomegalonema sp.]
MAEVAYLGVRHHGPGSARRVLARLNALQPGSVLIEGPSDLSDLLPALARPEMKPPVALLAYAEKTPESAVFWPMAEYSPEYQAALWALEHGAALRFIDLPVAQRFEPSPAGQEGDDPDAEAEPSAPVLATPRTQDPFSILGRLAGYEDGESFWNDLFETDGRAESFEAIDSAIDALRESEELTPFEARREAHMRLEIAKEAKAARAPVAVICGAWHVPALRAKHAAKADRDLLKGIKKEKIKASWAPWTSPRLAQASGYGAGVQAPKWYEHLWRAGDAGAADARWAVRIVRAMRDAGHVVSTASAIEVIRLAHALAALRQRPRPGFEELREASIACLSFGETLPWREIEGDLLLGSDVGRTPDDLPLAPLLDDLAREQKRTKLKPEAMDRELSLDLRTQSGLARSTLLHRLAALNVPWGRPQGAGRSRGTFRENWVLRWEPEFAVELVEKLVYGVTIQSAASALLTEKINSETRLAPLSDLTFTALTTQTPTAVSAAIARMSDIASRTDDCAALLSAVPSLVETIRYGQAREVDTETLTRIATQMITQAAIALPYAARGLDAEEAQRYFEMLPEAQRAMNLAELDADIADVWRRALETVSEQDASTPLVAGVATRICYESDYLSDDMTALRVTRAISPGVAISDAAGFFEGFFTGAGQRLIHDSALRRVVDAWLCALDEDEYIAHLPLMRRVFSGMDKNERRELLDRIMGRGGAAAQFELAPNADEAWAARLPGLLRILNKEAADA